MAILTDEDIAQQSNQQSPNVDAPISRETSPNTNTPIQKNTPKVLSDNDISQFDSKNPSQSQTPKIFNDSDIANFDKTDAGSIIGNMKAGQNPIQAATTQITQHPFRSALQGLPETMTGSSLEQDANQYEQSSGIGQSKTAPYDQNLGIVRPASLALTTAAQVGDMATAPINAVAGPIIKGVGTLGEAALGPMMRGVAGHGDVYRNLLNPGKGVVSDIEIKSGKDINDAFQTMADERLPIKSVVQNNRDTVDTNEARAQIRGKISGLYDQLQAKLQNSDAQFNLDNLKAQVDAKLRPIFKNDSDFESAQKEVDNEFEAAKRQRIPGYADASDANSGDLSQTQGSTIPKPDPVVDASTLSNMKEGMWQKGYNLLAPNSQKVSRIIGNTLKQAIEDAHPEDTDIKDLNQQMGNLQTVDGILQKAHSKVVNGGALGNYLRGGVGAVVGEQIGALLGHPVIGTGLGGFAGEQANRLLNNPELVTSTLSKIRDLHEFGGNVADSISDLFKKFGPDNINAPKDALNEAITPEVMGGKALPYNPKIGLNRALPSPTDAGQSSGPVINQEGYVPLGLPEGTSVSARSGVDVPAGKGLPSPGTAGQSSGPIIYQPAGEGQVTPPQKLLPKPETVYGDGFTMKNYKPQPINMPDSDRQDLADMLDWTAHQQPGERYSFINSEGQREYSGTPSGHAQSVQEIGPQESIHIMQKALLNKPLTPMQTLKVNKMLKDFQTNIKPKMNADVPPVQGEVEGNTDSPQDKPLGPDLWNNKGSALVGNINQKLNDQLTKHFGTTNDLNEAGYIMPGGKLLDFSGRHEATGYENSVPIKGKPDYLKGNRNVDHREVSQITNKHGDEAIQSVLNNGGIRIDARAGMAHLNMKPDAAQISQIKNMIEMNNGALTLDIGDNKTGFHEMYDEGTSPSKIIKDINTHFAGRVPNKFLGTLGPTAAIGAATGAVLGAKKATASQPDTSDRINLPADKYTKREEGFRGSIYKDTVGHNTVGYGFNVDDPSIRRMISNDVLNGKRELSVREADSIFSKAFTKAQGDAMRFVGDKSWGNLSASQQKALSDLSYNLGLHKLNGFHHMKLALQQGDYNKASSELLNSAYAKEVPNRARRNSELIKGNG